MRIAIMAPPWAAVPPDGYGGIEAVVDVLARGFDSMGHEVFLWTTGDSTCPVNRGYVLRVSAGDRIGTAAIELQHLLRGYDEIDRWGADIVHDHSLIGPIYAQRFRHLPVVTTNHGPFNEELTALYRAVATSVPLIAISRDQARRAGDVPIAAVIHHGVDMADFPQGDGAGDGAGPYFLFLGRMAPEKGARRAALAARQAGVKLVMAAKMREPWEHRFYAERVRPLLDDDIVYVGEVGHSERVRLLRGATALVNPIRWPEPFGLVMIEALACGTPVLAFGEGSAPEIIDDGVTGYLCDDVEDLARRMADAHLLDRAACRAAAKERFSAERMVQDHVLLFERVLRQHAGRAA